ncbi:tyrosine-protein kinase Drl-like [Pollicipes pollicipes]|uniref:tyrosine-protein kinase Drl-like n=1 Tax=Pollicipes pollicipes TaxID=41117 RepID=UPI001884D0C7|nr:tyrosine-protein kinase Drl-like [Pollicipes pollicipes]
MPYEISFRWNDPEAMERPRANISYVGYVPRVEQVFSVLFPCTGRLNAVVDVEIMLNITTYLPKRRITFLKLRRRKTCLQGQPTRLEAAGNDTVRLELSSEPDLSLVLGVTGAIAVTFVTLGGAMLLYVRQRKAAMSPGYAGTVSSGSRVFLKTFSKNYQSIDLMARSCSYATIASFKKMPLFDLGVTQPPSTPLLLSTNHGQGNVTSLPNANSDASRTVTSQGNSAGRRTVTSLPVKTSHHYASSQISCPERRQPNPLELAACLRVDRFDVTFTDLVAEGTFGRLYHGVVGGAGGGGRPRLCLVKTVSAQASAQQGRQLLADGLLLAGCSHPALLPVLGCCSVGDGPPCVLYADLGAVNLKQFLTSCRAADQPGGGRVIGPRSMVDMAVQLLGGLVHVHDMGLLHRDVAARNCVVDDRLRVRLTDGALSSDIYPAEYARLADGAWRPVRWAAPESLLRERHSPASDVWSAAVAAWEVASLGQLPFSELREPLEVVVLLREGYRLAQPPTCPPQLYTALLSCWAMEPDQRPRLRDLLTWMQDYSATFDRLI